MCVFERERHTHSHTHRKKHMRRKVAETYLATAAEGKARLATTLASFIASMNNSNQQVEGVLCHSSN